MQFIKGMELSRRFFKEAAQPVLEEYAPGLVYTAGMLGYGSDVLGYDDPVSADHMWGPRFYLFLSKEDIGRGDAILKILSERLPRQFLGYSVNFAGQGIRSMQMKTQGPVDPLIFIDTLDEYLMKYIGCRDFQDLSLVDWLTLSEHKLLSLQKAELYVDGLGLKERLSNIGYYPEPVKRYLLASNWALIAEEQAYYKRALMTGSQLNAILVAARITERLMRLCFIYCDQYAPYSKWFSRAFSELPLEDSLKNGIQEIMLTSDYEQRENLLAEAQCRLVEQHNQCGITETISVRIQKYYERDIQVIYADQVAGIIRETLKGTELYNAPLIGSMSQVANFTGLFDNPEYRDRMKALYT